MEMNLPRDPFTCGLLGSYTRKYFFGTISYDKIPKEFREKVNEELKENDLGYMIPDQK